MKSVLNVFSIQKTVLSLCMAGLLFAVESNAKPKALPSVRDFKSFNLKKNNVEKLTYKVYEPDGKELADFPVEFNFDLQGNRIKEVIYHIENKKTEAVVTWDYNTTAQTVIQIRLDTLSEQIWKRNYTQKAKPTTVDMKFYEPWFDEVKSEKHFEILSYEDLWTDIPKRKVVEQVRTTYSLDRGIISKKSTREFAVTKTQTIYDLIDMANATNDYTWLPLYEEDSKKSLTKSTRTEPLFDGTKFTYAAKKKLLSEKSKFNKDGSLNIKTTYAYEYDKDGNWVKLIQSENGKARFTVVREIVYRPKK